MTYLSASLHVSASFPFHSVCSPGSHLLLLRYIIYSSQTSPIQSVLALFLLLWCSTFLIVLTVLLGISSVTLQPLSFPKHPAQ